jgi:hypothetical protein
MVLPHQHYRRGILYGTVFIEKTGKFDGWGWETGLTAAASVLESMAGVGFG